MQLAEAFLRLPLMFDASALAAEISALPPRAWVAHPAGFPGNAAVRLVTTQGVETDDTFAPMAATAHLRACNTIMEVMAAIGAVWGRSRLMRLAPGATVPVHVDTHSYWRTHHRIHIPIITNPNAVFNCRGQALNMAAGECWVFDTFSNHFVRNGGEKARVHLVLDTVGGEGLWDLMEQARSGDGTPRRIAPGDVGEPELSFETIDTSGIPSPWELQCQIAALRANAQMGPELEPILKRLDRFLAGWTAQWARHGGGADGVPGYRRLIDALEAELATIGGGSLQLRNRLPLCDYIAELLSTMRAPLTAPIEHGKRAS